jgi:tRNA (mo5U34)-methyltransferase
MKASYQRSPDPTFEGVPQPAPPAPAPAARTTAPISAEETSRLLASVRYWHHKFELVPGVVTPGAYAPDFLWDMLEIGDAEGKTAIDIGACDGYFTRQLVRVGATVTAVDYRSKS